MVVFIRVRVGSLRRAYVSLGSFGLASAHSGANICRRVHSSSRGFTREHLGVAEFIRVRVRCA